MTDLQLLAEQVTPVVLTLNEEANLGRTLAALDWAKRVLVLDSGSTDGTEALARRCPNVTWATRAFDGHASQWAAAIRHPAVQTPYVLALDADMAPTAEFLREAAERVVAGRRAAGRHGFRYLIDGRPLLGSLYPPDTRLFRVDSVQVVQDGHTQRFVVSQDVVRLRQRVLHDDRKPLVRFLASQAAYAERECQRIVSGAPLRLRDRLRHTGWMPWPVFALAYLKAGGPLKGRASLRYAHERALYEMILAQRLLAAKTAATAAIHSSPEPRP